MASRRVYVGEHYVQSSILGIADPTFRPVQLVVIALLGCRRFESESIRARARFGQTERADRVLSNQRQVLVLESIGCVVFEIVGNQSVLQVHHHSDGRVHSGQLLDHQYGGHNRGSRSTILGINGDTHELRVKNYWDGNPIWTSIYLLHFQTSTEWWTSPFLMYHPFDGPWERWLPVQPSWPYPWRRSPPRTVMLVGVQAGGLAGQHRAMFDCGSIGLLPAVCPKLEEQTNESCLAWSWWGGTDRNGTCRSEGNQWNRSYHRNRHLYSLPRHLRHHHRSLRYYLLICLREIRR